jgi:Na+-translocating ferredoxin:NAD+ oxidoreductase subunit B
MRSREHPLLRMNVPGILNYSRKETMAEEVYRRLREQLDQYSVGFPSTATGVELKILRKLFRKPEAELFLHMSLLLETPSAIAERTKQPLGAVSEMLEGMADKGLIFRLRRDNVSRYAAVPFVIGFYEFQLPNMDRELAEMVEAYFEEAFRSQTTQVTLPLRTIPVNQAINISWEVAPYEDLKRIVRNKDRIAVADCICRVKQNRLGHTCSKPLEVCFSFGSHAEYYVERGMGRWIQQDEALKILDRCEETGLVPQPLNSQDPGGLCNCCGDCCDMLRALKRHPRPVDIVVSNYYAEVDPDLCAGCETCPGRCQMEAITMNGSGVASVNRDRCIGCGLCVTTCTAKALSLRAIPHEERRQPPATSKDMVMQMVQKRGKSLIPLALIR